MFKIGDKVKFKKSSIDKGMIDATEDDVFHVASVHNEHFGTLVKLEGVISAVSISHLEHVKEELMNNTEEQEIKWEGSQIDWQVGQTVWDTVHGKGEVDRVGDSLHYPVGVVFDNGDTRDYTLCGEIHEQAKRSLFFSRPVITAELFPPKKPFVPTLKEGEKILLKVPYLEEEKVAFVRREEDNILYYMFEDGAKDYSEKSQITVSRIGEEIKFES